MHLFVSGRRAPVFADPGEVLHELPDDALKTRLCALNGTPAEVLENPDLAAILLPLIRADLGLHENYRYQKEPPLSIPLSVFGGLGDPHAPPEDIGDWRQETTSAFTMDLFPGDHFFVHTQRKGIAQRVAQLLGAT
jgi:medium-chain acyl-[acyl-carrier-protein] hydrolase